MRIWRVICFVNQHLTADELQSDPQLEISFNIYTSHSLNRPYSTDLGFGKEYCNWQI